MHREKMTSIIESERLVLFPYTAENLHLFNTDLSAFEREFGVLYRGEELDWLLADFLRGLEKEIADDPENCLFFTEFLIVRKSDDTVIGSIDYKYVPKDGLTEVGYGLGKEWHNLGYMTEALTAFLEFGRKLGIRKVLADTEKDNIASQRVLQKCGFRYLREEKNLWWEKDLGSEDIPQLYLELEDDQWPFEYTDHDRITARAIVFDGEGYLYFVRSERDDIFGKAVTIETSGGGAEAGEDPACTITRELREELGAVTETVCRIGVVSDYYNLLHRHNINHYFLCRVLSFGERHLTSAETDDFHLSVLKLTCDEAAAEYHERTCTRLGKLLAARELPVLERAKEILSRLYGHEFLRDGN